MLDFTYTYLYSTYTLHVTYMYLPVNSRRMPSNRFGVIYHIRGGEEERSLRKERKWKKRAPRQQTTRQFFFAPLTPFAFLA